MASTFYGGTNRRTIKFNGWCTTSCCGYNTTSNTSSMHTSARPSSTEPGRTQIHHTCSERSDLRNMKAHEGCLSASQTKKTKSRAYRNFSSGIFGNTFTADHNVLNEEKETFGDAINPKQPMRKQKRTRNYEEFASVLTSRSKSQNSLHR